jgi:hypothetical protein
MGISFNWWGGGGGGVDVVGGVDDSAEMHVSRPGLGMSDTRSLER